MNILKSKAKVNPGAFYSITDWAKYNYLSNNNGWTQKGIYLTEKYEESQIVVFDTDKFLKAYGSDILVPVIDRQRSDWLYTYECFGIISGKWAYTLALKDWTIEPSPKTISGKTGIFSSNITYDGLYNKQVFNSVGIYILGVNENRPMIVKFLKDIPAVATAQTITLGSKLLAKLTDEDKKIATDKGWILA